MTWYRNKWWAIVNRVTNFPVTYNVQNFLTSRESVSFSKRIFLYGVVSQLRKSANFVLSVVLHMLFPNCKQVKNLLLPNDLRHDDANVLPLFRINVQNPDMNHTVMAKGKVRCVSGVYKDMYVAVNVVLLVPIYLPPFLCAGIDVNVWKKKEQSCGESKMTFRARTSPKCQDFVFKQRCHVSHWPLTDACIYSGDKWHTPTASWLSSPSTFTQVCDVRAPPTACCWRLNLKNRGSSDQGFLFFFYICTEIWRKSVQMEHQVDCVCVD